MFMTQDAYRTARRCGTLVKLYDAAADPRHPDHLTAQSTLQLMAADARGEMNAFGARACVRAAIAKEPYAVATDGPTTYVWT